MKLRRLTIALSMVGASTLGLVGCGGSSNDYPEIITLEGRAIDGYLSDATVCVDTNRNRVCDQGEPSAQTDGAGNYSIQSSDITSPLVLQSTANTFDITENAAVGEGLFLTAPQSSRTLTPLTTLAQIRSEVGKISYANAQAEIVTQLNLGVSSLDLTNYDYVAARESTNAAEATAARKALGTATAVANIIKANIATLASSSTSVSQKSQIGTAVYSLISSSTTPPIQNIVTAVNNAIDSSTDPDITTIVNTNTPTQSDLTSLADTVEEADTEEDVAVDTSGSSGSGGGSQ